jgi:hypothetical protein
MKHTILKSAVAVALGSLSLQALATGLVTLPTAGGTAYVACNTTGNFGSDDSIPPTQAANNTCAVFSQVRYDPAQGLINGNPPPVSGFARTARAYRFFRLNGTTTTTQQPDSVGRVTDEVWRSGTSCIYSAKVEMFTVDIDPVTAGIQTFELNDLARAGFRNRGAISAGYTVVTRGNGATDEVLFRAGRTYTSVPHPVGAPDLPPTSQAPFSTNWVDFTTDVNAIDPDGSSPKDSSWFYVRSSCTTATPTALANALELRETGQEGQPAITIKIPAYAPAGANVTP